LNFNISTSAHASDPYLLVLFQHKVYQSRCTTKNSWWWAERLPETCRIVILIKLEFSASVGFIHKESVTMHSHMIIEYNTNTNKCKIVFRPSLITGYPVSATCMTIFREE